MTKFNPYDADNVTWAQQEFGEKPWEQLSGESSRAYSAFSMYMNMPVGDRSVLKVHRLLTGNNAASKPAANLIDWSKQFSWIARAAFWDRFRDEAARTAELKKLAEMGESRAQAYMAMVRVALTIIQKSDLQNMTPDTARGMLGLVTNFIDVGARGNRVEVGQPDQTIKVDVTSQKRKGGRGFVDDNPNPLSMESLERIIAGKFQVPPTSS